MKATMLRHLPGLFTAALVYLVGLAAGTAMELPTEGFGLPSTARSESFWTYLSHNAPSWQCWPLEPLLLGC